MENEVVDRRTMTLKDLLMMIPREDIESEIKNNITPENENKVSVEAVADSILETLSVPEGLFVNKNVEFDSIYSLLEDKIPLKDEEGQESKKFGLNSLRGDKDPKNIYQQVCKIFQDLIGDVPEQNFSANILSSAFARKSALDALQRVIFIENYEDLSYDLRQTLHMLSERGVKLVIASEVGETRPFDAFATAIYDKGYKESAGLKNNLCNAPQLRISEKPAKKEERVA
jgi:hypothetical protein